MADDEAESREGIDEERHAHTKHVDTDDKECRAHAKRVDEQPRRVKTSEAEATTTIPRAPESMSLEGERTRQSSDGSSEPTVRETDWSTNTNASARSASRIHPTDTETTTDLRRPSEDPADTTGDVVPRPDEPTEPPDKPKGAGGREGEESGEEVARRVLGESGERAEATGDDDDNECRPRKPREPPDRPSDHTVPPDHDDATRTSGGRTGTTSESESISHDDLRTELGSDDHVPHKAQREMKHRGDGTNGRDDETGHAQVTTAEMTNPTESRGHAGGVGEVHDDGGGPGEPYEPSVTLHEAARDPAHVHVDPGGGTHAERNGSVALERPDAGIDGEVGTARHDVQDEVERPATRRKVPIEGERGSALACERPTTAVEENDQPTSTDDDNSPEDPPDPPPLPDEPAIRSHEPQSFELEGGRRAATSCDHDVEPTSGEADASGASGRVEDARNKPTKVSERVSKRSEPWVRENSPNEARIELEASKRDATPRRDAQRHQERPSKVRNECADETNSPSRDTGLGGQLDHQEDSGHVEGVRERRNVVEGAEYDWIGRVHDGNECGVETNALRPDTGTGGHLSLEVDPRGVEVDSGGQKVVDNGEHDGEHARDVEDKRVVETSALCRDTGPGDPNGDQTESGDDEVDRDRRKVVDGAECDGIHPRSVGAERVVETNALRRVFDPGGPRGDPEASKGVESVWGRGEVVDDGETDGVRPRSVRMNASTERTHRIKIKA